MCSRENKIYDSQNRKKRGGNNSQGKRWSYTKDGKIQILWENHEMSKAI